MMAGDGARGQRTIHRRQLTLIWLCLCSAILLAGQSQSLTTISSSPPTLEALDEAYSSTTDSLTTTTTITTTTTTEEEEEEEEEQQQETSSLAASTERTSNAIPEAEQSTSELLKKYSAKKLDKEASSSGQLDQLDKPYPYLKKAAAGQADKEDKENAIRQAKRSGDSLALNGTLQLSVSRKSSTSAPDTTTTTTTIATTATTAGSSTTTTTVAASTIPDEQDIASTTPELATSLSDDENDQTTTTQSTLRTTESTTPFTDKSSVVGDTETESPTTQPTTQSMPSISTTSTTTTSSSSSLAETNVPTTTITESTPTTTAREEPTTTPAEQDSTTITTTSGVTVPPETITTAEPTVLAASTRLAPATNLTLPPTTTTILTTRSANTTPLATTTTTSTTTSTTTTTTTTTTTAKPSTTTTKTTMAISPKNIATTTMTSEVFSAVTTWPDENSEPTTEPFSPTPPPEDVTLLVRILLEGSWQEVCSKLPILRQSLADLLNKKIDKPISTRQIIFHQTQCSSDNLPATSLGTDIQLTPVLVYVVDENGNFDSKLTKLLPSLYESSPFDFPLTIHSVTLMPEADSGNAIAVVIVSCVAFICLILLAGLLVIMRKRQGRFNYGERCRPVSLDAYSLDSVSAYNSVRRNKAVVRSSKRSYGNPAFEDSSVTPTHPLNFAGIATFCNDTNAVAEEFAGIPQIHSKIEELPPGAEIKNRYANGIPLPETRVPLQRINNDPLSEYINASYVRGPKNATKYYIACQAPTEATVADFWRMIWEQQCKVIIMLTDLVENGVDKCTEYIPPLEVSDCHRLYGDYQVTLKKREAKEKYAISTLHLKNLENNTFREVSHIWYLWPPSGVPADAAGLIAVLLEARALQRGAAGPIVVHCSPGTGRTGTLIALDLCIRQYEVTRTVDVPRVVYTIRRDRAGAVQTREQYLFIYKGLNLYASKLAGGGIDST